MDLQVCVCVLCVLLAQLHMCKVQAVPEDFNYEDYDHDLQPKNCSVKEKIVGGWVSYTDGGTTGSVLTYQCHPGQYAFPISERMCDTDTGEWSTMRHQGRIINQATCRDVTCPAQLQLDNGVFWPRRQWFRPGEVQQFSCLDGFVLRGSALRNCTLLGVWSGHGPVCDDMADDCPHPGTPPGAHRSGNRFRVNEKVSYQCQRGLDLLGSAERVCLETREWSGSEPRCLAPFTFDSPESVSHMLTGSLTGKLDASLMEKKKSETVGRTINVSDGRLNLYILLDTSGSITEEQFHFAKNVTAKLIQRLDSYEVEIKYHVVSYATQVREIVSIMDYYSSEVDEVLEKLEKFDYKEHKGKTGTNLYAALNNVYDNMAKNNRINDTQHVILIVTDGHSNTGNNPKLALDAIRALLGFNTDTEDDTREDLLDVYVFAVGDRVNKKELNAIASKKRDEKHFFVLRGYESLGKVFDSMISDEGVNMCGVAKTGTTPWHVDVKLSSAKMEKCQGSIITRNWVLTAAHCFTSDLVERPERVTIHYGGEGSSSAARVIVHPHYDVRALRQKKVEEFYDYDIALVKLKQSVQISHKARPICLPCTKASDRALKMRLNSTCEQQEKALLQLDLTPASFLTANHQAKRTYIHRGRQRPDCIKHAALTFSANSTATLEEFVTDRYLCTGSSERDTGSITCKGDSGGSLFLRNGHRYFQVAVLSWGTIDLCSSKANRELIKSHTQDSPPEHARDFHISVFSVLPWLQQHLSTELQFLT